MTSNSNDIISGTLIPASKYSVEIRIKNSRFIASIGPAFTVDEAKIFIRDINQLHPDANHNVPVYLIGSGSSVIAHARDDGEPSGTAGRPALSVLKGSGLGDTVLVITRYFGGIKLGTGGLVKAYSESAREAIKGVQKAKKVLVHQCQINCPYPFYEQIKRLLVSQYCKIDNELFTDHVQIEFSILTSMVDNLILQIAELSNGQIKIQTIKENSLAILPIKS